MCTQCRNRQYCLKRQHKKSQPVRSLSSDCLPRGVRAGKPRRASTLAAQAPRRRLVLPFQAVPGRAAALGACPAMAPKTLPAGGNPRAFEFVSELQSYRRSTAPPGGQTHDSSTDDSSVHVDHQPASRPCREARTPRMPASSRTRKRSRASARPAAPPRRRRRWPAARTSPGTRTTCSQRCRSSGTGTTSRAPATSSARRRRPSRASATSTALA